MIVEIDEAAGPVAEAFDALGIEYYVSGSVVSSVYGVGRSTSDVDVVAALPLARVADLVARLGDAYYADVDAIRDAVRRRSMFNVIHMATAYKVDVYIASTEFDRSALARAVDETIPPGAHRFRIVTAEDVVLHKLHWYRIGGHVSERQWSDILGVLRTQRGIDRAYMREWAERLGVADLLERAIDEAAG